MSKEIRTLRATELRAKGGTGAADPLRIEGYAAVFNTYSHDLGGFIERVKPGAFSRGLFLKQDVRALINHDPNLVLGRTKSGTLALAEDTKGLKFVAVLPNTQYARDLHESVSRGDIDQCSFSFKPVKQTGCEMQKEKGNYSDTEDLKDEDLF